MSVHTKPDGRVFCVYYDDKGKQVWESFGRDPESTHAAETRDLEIKLQKRKSRPIQRPSSSLTWQELVQLYIIDRKNELSKSTRYGILYAVNTYTTHLFKKPISAIAMLDCALVEDSMKGRQTHIYKAPLTNRTINTYMHYLRKIWDWAASRPDIAIHQNPWSERKNLRTKHQKFKLELFSIDEFRRILAQAPAHLAWIMEVAYYTGVRTGKSELFALLWSDLDFKTGRLRVRGSKTAGSFRTVPIDKAFLRRLRARQKAQTKDFPNCPYICHFNGRPVKSVKRAWTEAKTAAGIARRIRLQDIRHYYITYALAAGTDIMELAETVGHVDVSMIIKVYTHLARDIRKTQATKLPDLHPRKQKRRRNSPAAV